MAEAEVRMGRSAASTAGPAFEAFFDAEYPRLFRAMWLMTGSRQEGEDLAQEAMARAFERWGRVRAARDPAAYVYTIALNLNRRRLRRAALARRHEVDPPGLETVDDAERRQDVHRALQRISRAQREALVLIEWVGLSANEAASVLRIEPASVRGRVHRAREALRSLLGGGSDG